MSNKTLTKSNNKSKRTPARIEKLRRQVDGIATLGLLLVAAGMLLPFVSLSNGSLQWLEISKWIYAAGALIFTIARIVNVNDPSDSLRLRRLRRLEFWAGMAFCIAAFLWFYNEAKFAGMMFIGPLAILRDTVLFSLAGAAIQVIASWMIAFRMKKEKNQRDAGQSDEKKK